jgi:spore maturation protein CgeB
MTGQQSPEKELQQLEQEIRELREANQALERKQQDLIHRLREYESAFYTQLGERDKVYKKTWTWRIGRLFVAPADWLMNLFISKKKAGSDRATVLKTGRETGTEEKARSRQSSHETSSSYQPDPHKDNFAVIFDTFTQSCFSPEFNTIPFTPFNWHTILEEVPVKGLFIESAWNGNEGSWTDQVASLERKSDPALVKLIRWAKERHIPTAFWNKEDPVHFDQFIEAARHCDHIFTTDAGCTEAYRKKAPGAAVHALPFAAQPKIHNPLASEGRTGNVCFAGTYYGHRYHERKNDMDFLLKPALEFGLDIYDRNFGNPGKYAENLRFPEIYHGAIRGKLEYSEMLKAYKRYKVFLNVNSVRYSPTMFARRVFELLACGTPVISNYSEGIIKLLGEGTVLISESEDDTRKHLEHLLTDELYWWKMSLNGMRTVLNHHTYGDRARTVYEALGLKYPDKGSVRFTLVSKVASMNQIRYLEKMLRRQLFTAFDVVLIKDGERFDEDLVLEIRSLFSPIQVNIMHTGEEQLEKRIMESFVSTHLAFIDAGKYYGPHYLNDFALALNYADPDVMGKKSIRRIGAGNSMETVYPGNEFRYVASLDGAASVHRKNTIDPFRIRDYASNATVTDESMRILSIDPFNFLDAEFPLNEGIFSDPVLKQADL